MLAQIGRFLPISVFTMKDLSFVMPRTPFAHAWSAIGGLEMRIGKRVLKRECLEHTLSNVSVALEYAKSQTTSSGVEVEEKQDSEGRTVAFCVDWRRARDSKMARHEAERIAAYCKASKLRVIKYESQPFYDVCPVAPDKGRALQEMLNELAMKNCGVLYLGDSEMDNPAFRVSDISIGVIHDDIRLKTLDCDYLVEFENVPDFLNALLANSLLFSSDLPMIKTNHDRRKKN
jgi:hydroxymethylpyrimidine pyrophosphatase-like HAD family hydrolase